MMDADRWRRVEELFDKVLDCLRLTVQLWSTANARRTRHSKQK